MIILFNHYKTKKMAKLNFKKNYKTLIGTAVSVSTMMITVNWATKSFNSSSIDKMIEGVQIFNKELPKQVDFMTVMDSVKLTRDKVLTYYYTADLQILSDEELEDFSFSRLKSSILENVTNDKDLGIFRKEKITFEYIYNDINGSILQQYMITPQMYKKP